MDKRYQVFISSTYKDLQEERKEVMQALLELDCIPAGMELFPASNDDQWTLIKKVIDDCDYYILILGGRYGSVNTEGMGYTEMEYRYAIETHKPVIAFLHKNPDEIKSSNTEVTPEGRKKLEDFRKIAQTKMTKYWTSPADLGSVVSRSMVRLMKDFPAVGWVKSDTIVDDNSIKEILRLQKENEALRKQLEVNKTQAPEGTSDLAQGNDTTVLQMVVRWEDNKDYEDHYSNVNVEVSWNTLFHKVSPYLINEASEDRLKAVISELIKDISNRTDSTISEIMNRNDFDDFVSFNVYDSDFQTVKVQLKALGLIKQSNKSRSIKDKMSYWSLTEYGDYIMTQLIAQRRG